jgi:predicted nucleic acid-binding protein
MSRIFFDTNLFIYLMEDDGVLGQRVVSLLERISERRDEVITSTLTLAEVLVRPLSEGDMVLAEKYKQLLNSPGVSMLAFDQSSAWAYAQLRKDKSIKAPDAIQLATAASARCDLFLTNDERLSRKIVPGIQFISSLERAML